jgi:hypothetical protein
MVLNMTQGFLLLHFLNALELSQHFLNAQGFLNAQDIEEMFVPCIHIPRTSGPCSSPRMPHTCGTASDGGSAPAQHEHRRNPGHTWSLGPKSQDKMQPIRIEHSKSTNSQILPNPNPSSTRTRDVGLRSAPCANSESRLSWLLLSSSFHDGMAGAAFLRRRTCDGGGREKGRKEQNDPNARAWPGRFDLSPLPRQLDYGPHLSV